MNADRIKELLCVVVLVVFIVFLSGNSSISKASGNDVFKAVNAEIKISKTADIKKCNNQRIKKEFGFTHNDFEYITYYASDSVMEVRELLIIKLQDKSQLDSVNEAIEKRVKDKAELFKGYAPEQSAMLEKYVLEYKKGFVIYAVSDTPDKLISAFNNAI
ncbi:MAG: DUF4358 domain-containing protein [Oscillospiraceae bacterium]|nr:DUF4358 domain-containing protein [Oscillospiraceae bacterium]